MTAATGVAQLIDNVARWGAAAGVRLPAALSDPDWAIELWRSSESGPCRPPADARKLRSWEYRHNFHLPATLRAWLEISDGLYAAGPLVHPVTAIGPMIPFAKVPEIMVQPESWFELGNPGRETLCIDLAYRWPGGGCPIFLSGDDVAGTAPRLIAPSFEDLVVKLLLEGGREYWFDADFVPLGNPWSEHRRRTPMPPLPERLRPLAPRVLPLMRPGADDRSIATMLGVSRGDVEALFRHLQHAEGILDVSPLHNA